MLSLARGKEGSFKLVSGYKPEGDQPAAIEAIVTQPQRQRAASGAARRHRLGQDLHDGQRDRASEPPDAGDRAEQDPRRPALQRVQEPVSRKRRPLFRLLLRLLSARGVRSFDRHLHREGREHQRRDRQAAPFRHQGAARAQRRADRRVGLVHLRSRRAGSLLRDAGLSRRGPDHRSRPRCCASWSISSTSATTTISIAGRSACAATRSRFFRPTKSSARCGSNSSATRSKRCTRSTRCAAR